MKTMSPAEMSAVMGMNDNQTFTMLKLDRLERSVGDGAATAWKADAWIGPDFNRLLIRSEGEYSDGGVERGDLELLWGHAVASFWNTTLGVRRDFGRGADRNWVAFGVQGLAPYWFDVETTAYLGAAGRSALRTEIGYEILLTQRWILRPRVEINAYGKSDRATRVGAGLADIEAGLRLRYEIRREFAPYIGVEFTHLFAGTADFARADGRGINDTRLVAGIRVWY